LTHTVVYINVDDAGGDILFHPCSLPVHWFHCVSCPRLV